MLWSNDDNDNDRSAISLDLTPDVNVGPAKPLISTHFNLCQRSKGSFFEALAY